MPNPMEFEFWFKPGGPTGPGPDWPTGNMAVISFSVQRENSPFGGVLENVGIGHHNELETLDKVWDKSIDNEALRISTHCWARVNKDNKKNLFVLIAVFWRVFHASWSLFGVQNMLDALKNALVLFDLLTLAEFNW